ncbi:glycerate kinase [Acidovorax sp. NCPPB 2350]|nr:glycerate kinase [Acidovorax sp. NCPPB 2350]
MNLRRFFIPVLIVLLLFTAHRVYGWQGIFAVGGGLLMWALLHFTRLMNVMRKAADRPIGHVGSAVMLNAKLREGVNLMHVVAMTRALGQVLSAEGEEPERYRWTDGTGSHVTCEFRGGRLVSWELVRPAQDEGSAGAPGDAGALPPGAGPAGS